MAIRVLYFAERANAVFSCWRAAVRAETIAERRHHLRVARARKCDEFNTMRQKYIREVQGLRKKYGPAFDDVLREIAEIDAVSARYED